MDRKPPWDLYPPLTPYRLFIAARLIADVRHEVVLLHEDSKGDNNWSLGCRVYARTCHMLLLATEQYEWLTIIENTGLHFVFAIGGVPLRFYRGEPDNAPPRSLQRHLPELHAQQMSLFGETSDHGNDILRFAVETDTHGEAERISLVRLIEEDGKGTLLNTWIIDFKNAPPVVSIEKKREGVQLLPAKVLPFKTDDKKKEDDEDA